MAILNKASFKAKFNDFIDRISPFTDPLIQKSEHKELISDDLGDSVVFSTATEASINSPAAAFNVDFLTNDSYTVDTTGVGTTAFTITLVNLDGNRTGKIRILKKSGDTFTFANAEQYPFDNTTNQSGLTEIRYIIKKTTGTNFVSIQSYDNSPAGGVLSGNYPDPAFSTESESRLPVLIGFINPFTDTIEYTYQKTNWALVAQDAAPVDQYQVELSSVATESIGVFTPVLDGSVGDSGTSNGARMREDHFTIDCDSRFNFIIYEK